VTFILVIAAAVQFTEMTVRKVSPPLFQMLGIYLPLITTNCAVLGVTLLLVDGKMSFLASTLFAFASSLGYSLVMVIFAGLRERLALADVPRLFAGLPSDSSRPACWRWRSWASRASARADPMIFGT